MAEYRTLLPAQQAAVRLVRQAIAIIHSSQFIQEAGNESPQVMYELFNTAINQRRATDNVANAEMIGIRDLTNREVFELIRSLSEVVPR